MTPLHVAETLRGWIVLERGIVKFIASTKQLWTTRLGIAQSRALSLSLSLSLFLSLSLSLSLSPSYPFSSSPSCSPLVSPLLRFTYIWDPLTCRNVLAHDVTTNIISCRSPWAVIYDTADWIPTCELEPGVFHGCMFLHLSYVVVSTEKLTFWVLEHFAVLQMSSCAHDVLIMMALNINMMSKHLGGSFM